MSATLALSASKHTLHRIVHRQRGTWTVYPIDTPRLEPTQITPEGYELAAATSV